MDMLQKLLQNESQTKRACVLENDSQFSSICRPVLHLDLSGALDLSIG